MATYRIQLFTIKKKEKVKEKGKKKKVPA